jgi:hypothetical protein
MTYKDLREVREHYATLRELVIRKTGGWDDADTRARTEGLCGEAMAALDDAECRERLRAVRDNAGELFSREGHLRWARKNMTGADYLRLQILIALEAVNTRLFFLEAQRNGAAGAQARSLLAAGHAP